MVPIADKRKKKKLITAGYIQPQLTKIIFKKI